MRFKLLILSILTTTIGALILAYVTSAKINQIDLVSSRPTQEKIQNQVLSQQESSTNQIEEENTIDFSREKVKVIRVIDGDTIEIEGGKKVRYIGIDTPESTITLDCFGQEAAAKNRDLVDGKIIGIEKDVSQTDKYGRILRYIWIDQTLVNDYLVRQGFAYASSYPPDIKYQDQLTEAQKEARENNRGLWESCQAGSSQPQDSNCQIKGNISSSGEKIYHLPDQKYWSKTVIEVSRGERWFCTEEEAQDALWRKSKI